ncbi:hypothetical protein [Candidatus Palauibacter sp.]|uniref:hypothetical protein n=1 Tax=Candidatus Palauibacter sp. TaxID=3101350 RepID=UPI003B0274A0
MNEVTPLSTSDISYHCTLSVHLSVTAASWFDMTIVDDDEYHEDAFAQLVDQWYEERNEAASSLAETIACPAYLRIIGMGRRSVPFIIDQLKREGDEPDHWGAALEAITGENPVPRGVYGDTVGIANAWITWADRQTDILYVSRTRHFLDLQQLIIKSLVHKLAGTTVLLGLQEQPTPIGGLGEDPTISGRVTSAAMEP